MCKCTWPGHEVHPLARARAVFAEWPRFGGIFRRSVRATTRKRSSTFLAKKCTPKQNPGYVYAREIIGNVTKRVNVSILPSVLDIVTDFIVCLSFYLRTRWRRQVLLWGGLQSWIRSWLRWGTHGGLQGRVQQALNDWSTVNNAYSTDRNGCELLTYAPTALADCSWDE